MEAYAGTSLLEKALSSLHPIRLRYPLDLLRSILEQTVYTPESLFDALLPSNGVVLDAYQQAKALDNPQLYPFIVTGLETSMRQSEILSIRRENIDLARRVIWIPKAKAGKREQRITAHLAAFLADWMAALPPGTPWLFPSSAAKSGHTVDIRNPLIAYRTKSFLVNPM